MSTKYYDWISHHAKGKGDKVAIVDLDNDKHLTYFDLDKRATSFAAWLVKNGVEKGERIAVLMRNAPEFFEIQFACHKIGAICLPLNWRLTKSELEYILKDSTPMLLIHDKVFRTTASELVNACVIQLSLEINEESQNSSYEDTVSTNIKGFNPVGCSHSDVSMIMYTSGTTGHPKGALITHGMTFFNCVNLGIPALINSESVQLVTLPLFHTAGLNCYSNPLFHAGGKVILTREFDPGKTLNVLGNPEYGVTHFMGVPSVFLFIMQHPDFDKTDLSRIKQAGIGGAPCAEPILLKWLDRGVPLVQGWGMTETSPGGTGLDVVYARKKIGSCGKPLLHTEIKIVNEKGEKANAGEIGELLIRGPNITPGYWNNEEATAASFIDGWLKTGDAAKEDEDGFLFIVDRWKDMYISGGENVYPAEVENIIYQMPEIAEAAVIGIPNEQWGEVGIAVVVIKKGLEITGNEIIENCKNRLAKFKVPNDVKFIDKLPRNATGKVLKREIKKMFVEI
ncbi:MAG: long-chain-fatty-acid--CoA ligase [Alphaproteobacteria bacterium TMED93]|nr:MAG: long-chain-fatty-acid--CoA ligase [Alphaproteobacteria bacterium TMED93]